MVSIPNGDRHYLERKQPFVSDDVRPVSIPNGDRHYLELPQGEHSVLTVKFQSPMGIGITSNYDID